MQIFTEYPILVPLTASLTAETLKILITFFRTGKFDIKMMFHTGGMPSGHSSLVTAMATTVFVLKGIHSAEFVIALVFAIIVVFDAVKLRGEAGKHAVEINKILKKNLLSERLGHTPYEVLGGIITGITVASLLLLF